MDFWTGENLHGDEPQIYQQTGWLGTEKEERTQKPQELYRHF